jgi:hypothetical protein
MEHLSSPPDVSGGSCYSIFSFMCRFCRSFFALLPFSFWTLCYLFFFDMRILITLWYLQTLLNLYSGVLLCIGGFFLGGDGVRLFFSFILIKFNLDHNHVILIWLYCLTPLSTAFHLYRGSQLY